MDPKLLNSIHVGAKLKKVATNDRSTPLVAATVVNNIQAATAMAEKALNTQKVTQKIDSMLPKKPSPIQIESKSGNTDVDFPKIKKVSSKKSIVYPSSSAVGKRDKIKMYNSKLKKAMADQDFEQCVLIKKMLKVPDDL